KPILYKVEMGIRFDDLDPYMHVNSSKYLDYVISSRWNFADQVLGVTLNSLVKRGVGFYLTKSIMNFKKPIAKVQNVTIESLVTNVEGAMLYVDYRITDGDQKVYSDGSLHICTIDLKTNAPTSLPEDLYNLFFMEN